MLGPSEIAAGFPARPGPAPVGRWIADVVFPVLRDLIDDARGRPLRAVETAFDLRGRMAGQARLLPDATGLVRINRQLFDFPENRFYALRDTALHEMAHLCVMSCWPAAAAHGRRWRAVAERLGATPRATHELPLRRARAVLEYAYRVNDELVWLGATRHARLQAGRAVYRVRTAVGPRTIERLAFTGETRTKES